MTRRSVALSMIGGLLLLLWLFTGVERAAREHGEIDYELSPGTPKPRLQNVGPGA